MNDDFLSKFSGDKYNKNANKDDKDIDKKDLSSKELEEKKPEKAEVLEDKEPVVLEEKPSLKAVRKQEETFVKEEETEIDPTYKKRKKRQRIGLAIGGVVLVGIAAVVIYFMMTVQLIDFKDKQVSEVKKWALENKINLDIEQVFSLEYPTNVVISQDMEPGKRINKNDTVKIQVSKGADPDEVIVVPEFKGATVDELRQWAQENKLDNINYQNDFSDKVEKDVIIKIVFNDKDVDAKTYKRKNRMTVIVSQGKEVFEKNIKVPNFKDKTEAEVKAWHTEQKFIKEFVFEEAYDDKVLDGMIISQSISADTMVAKDEVITFVISKGKALVVPNFAGTNIESFKTFSKGGVMAESVPWYSPSVPYGYFISQSIESGVNLSESPETVVEVYYSLGQPYITFGDLNGKTPPEIEKYFFEMNAKGTSLTYSIEYRKNKGNEPDCADGLSFGANKVNRYVAMDEHITVYVGKGCPLQAALDTKE